MSTGRSPSSRHEPVLRCIGVTKYYGGLRALDDVSLDLLPGQVVGLVGDNGAGKSTLTKVISGLERPDRGELWIGGERVRRSRPGRVRALGVETVAQTLNLCDNLDAVSNVMLGQEPVKFRIGPVRLLDRAQARIIARAKLAEIGVALPRLDAPIRTLSGGQRQAIAIARALVQGHRLILFDEPTAALGVRQRKSTLALVRRIASEGVSVVVISHSIEDIFEVADRVVALRLGRVVLDGAVDSVTSSAVMAAMAGVAADDPAGADRR